MTSGGFEAFYRDTRDACFRALIVAIGDVEEARDLLSESYAKSLARWDSVAAHPAPSAWVIRTAMNLHRDRWRKMRRFGRVGLQRAEFYSDSPDLPVDRRLLDALWRLPKRQREVIALRVLLDFDTERCAQSLGIAEGTVTTHLHRGLSRLRDELVTEDDLA